LKYAIAFGHLKIVKFLLPFSDPKSRNNEALKIAIRNDYREIIKLLIPVSDINKSTKNWITQHCENPEIKRLIL